MVNDPNWRLPDVPTFELSSPELKPGHYLPLWARAASAGGEDRSPTLSWSGAPDAAKSFVVTLYDPDAHHPSRDSPTGQKKKPPAPCPLVVLYGVGGPPGRPGGGGGPTPPPPPPRPRTPPTALRPHATPWRCPPTRATRMQGCCRWARSLSRTSRVTSGSKARLRPPVTATTATSSRSPRSTSTTSSFHRGARPPCWASRCAPTSSAGRSSSSWRRRPRSARRRVSGLRGPAHARSPPGSRRTPGPPP